MAIESKGGLIIEIIEGSILVFYKFLGLVWNPIRIPVILINFHRIFVNHKYSLKAFNSLIKFSAYKAVGDEISKEKESTPIRPENVSKIT